MAHNNLYLSDGDKALAIRAFTYLKEAYIDDQQDDTTVSRHADIARLDVLIDRTRGLTGAPVEERTSSGAANHGDPAPS